MTAVWGYGDICCIAWTCLIKCVLKPNPRLYLVIESEYMLLLCRCDEWDQVLTCRVRGTPASARAPAMRALSWLSDARCAADPCRTTDPRSAGCTCSGGCRNNLPDHM